ncbi:AIM24 family protein [Aquimarina gracilis]|uniref:AIM24 family protein n=1 Tax=Aquimarina gracilis TaxID=874422 RepID=A0ABU6A1N7_9FLAO|nr:AIM24 family protein [Aquimarina gracilis]MEB3347970.1 AIM24 family protein [Aquimarina gracilis]
MNNFIRLKERFKKEGLTNLFLFIVLVGILPAVEDFSLFAIFGFSITSFHVHEEFQFLYALPLYLIPIGLLLVMGGKNYYRILGLLPTFFAGYVHLLGSAEEVSLKEYEALIGILHFLCYKIAFLYFVIKGKLRSIPFILILLLVWILLDIQHLILFLTYTILIRFLYLAIRQNIEIFKETGFRKTVVLGAKSFLYWSPLLLFIIPGAILNSKMNKASIDQIYDKTFIISTNEDRKYKRDQFEKDLDFSLEAQIICMQEAVKNGTGNINTIVKNKTENLDDLVAIEYKKIFKETLPEVAPVFKEEDCGFWGKLNFLCQAKNSAKKTVNDSYKVKRDSLLTVLTGQVRDAANGTQKEIHTSTENINRTIREQIGTFTDKLKLTIQSTFDTITFINLLLDIAFGFLILKSFLYVFSRVAFSSDDENYVTLLESDSNISKGTLSKFGNQYTIDPEVTKDNYFISRSFEPSGRAPKFSLPQWKSAILARIRTRNYAMNKVQMSSRPEKVHFKAMGSHEFVEWDIKEGEEVVFHFKNFVGMSEGIKISAVVSLRLTSLLFGRVIFTTAKGPGKLILLTKGEPVIAGESVAESSIATSRILAWQKNTRFNVESELNFVDVFMSGIYLKKKEEDLILIDADVKGPSKNGIVRFIKNFILPV